MQFQRGMKIGELASNGAGVVTRPQPKDPVEAVATVGHTIDDGTQVKTESARPVGEPR